MQCGERMIDYMVTSGTSFVIEHECAPSSLESHVNRWSINRPVSRTQATPLIHPHIVHAGSAVRARIAPGVCPEPNRSPSTCIRQHRPNM